MAKYISDVNKNFKVYIFKGDVALANFLCYMMTTPRKQTIINEFWKGRENLSTKDINKLEHERIQLKKKCFNNFEKEV